MSAFLLAFTLVAAVGMVAVAVIIARDVNAWVDAGCDFINAKYGGKR